MTDLKRSQGACLKKPNSFWKGWTQQADFPVQSKAFSCTVQACLCLRAPVVSQGPSRANRFTAKWEPQVFISRTSLSQLLSLLSTTDQGKLSQGFCIFPNLLPTSVSQILGAELSMPTAGYFVRSLGFGKVSSIYTRWVSKCFCKVSLPLKILQRGLLNSWRLFFFSNDFIFFGGVDGFQVSALSFHCMSPRDKHEICRLADVVAPLPEESFPLPILNKCS